MQQVITITPNGGLHSLQTKRGHGVDLRQFGHAEIHRATIIEWVSEEQAWQIAFLDRDGSVADWLDRDLWYAVNAALLPNGVTRVSPYGNTLLFSDYEDAVAAEIETINQAKLTGYKLPGQ